MILSVEQVCKIFDQDLKQPTKKVLTNLSFSLQPHSITGFLGANGSGKTTTIKILLNLMRATSGEVRYGSLLGGSYKSALPLMGYAPESPNFYSGLTAKEFLTYIGQLSGFTLAQLQPMIKSWMEKLNLDFAINKQLKTYSKGMLQKMAFICAVLHRPQLLILDEPTAGLDPLSRLALKEIIKKLRENEGTTIFFSTHILSDVEDLCDQIVFIDKGQCRYNGPLAALIFDQEQKEYKISFEQQGQFFNQVVSQAALMQTLQQIDSQGAKLISVSLLKKSLEQVLYPEASRNQEMGNAR